MRLPDLKKPLIVIVGPTAVGKTNFSIRLAEKIGGEIVSADSRLFYKGMDIGTAKPSPNERKKVKHHLIDIINIDEKWCLADFQKEAARVISGIYQHGKIPILVGGTGQYIWGLLQGWSLIEVKPNFELRRRIEKWGRELGPETLHEKLAIIDPVAAKKIEPKNLRRTVRAIEVIFTTGVTFSEQYKKSGNEYSYLLIGLIRDRGELYERIDHRIDSMIANGLVEEIDGLLKKGNPVDLPAFSAIGYSQIIDYLQGKISLEEAIRLIRRQSRIFVRRQSNWFKENDRTIHWFNAGQADLLQQVISTIKDPLSWIKVGNKNG
jgi:tRNA dimethylallyltransferase